MNKDQADFMNLRKKPGRLNAEQTGWYMGFNPTEVTILISSGLLKPLGKPAQNSVRFFARADLDRYDSDPKWLDKASLTLGRHWRTRNERLRKKTVLELPPDRLQQKIISTLRKAAPNQGSQ